MATENKAPAKRATAKKASAKKSTAKKAAGKKAPTKKAAASASEKKLVAQLAKIEKQVLANKKEQVEFRKQGREVARVVKNLEKTRDELDHFRDWSRTYFEEICTKFEGLAAEQLGQAELVSRLDGLEARLEEVASATPASSSGATVKGKAVPAVSAKEATKLQDELQQVTLRLVALREEMTRGLEEVRTEAQGARNGLDDLVSKNWQPVGWQEAPPEVL
jgi:hypothetical protein